MRLVALTAAPRRGPLRGLVALGAGAGGGATISSDAGSGCSAGGDGHRPERRYKRPRSGGCGHLRDEAVGCRGPRMRAR
jgi:hypothetical protein